MKYSPRKFYFITDFLFLLFIILYFLNVISIGFLIYVLVLYIISTGIIILRIIKYKSFDYDIKINDFKRDSIKYYINSKELFFENLVFDNNGVPKNDYGKLGVHYNPALIGWYGLCLFNQDKVQISKIEKIYNWIINNKVGKKTFFIWQYNFDWREGKAKLRKPWYSAMSQGLLISFLIRYYRLTKDSRALEIAKKASDCFLYKAEDGGVKIFKNNSVLYEEYPVKPYSYILDGFIFSLLGLYDLYLCAKDEKLMELFDQGINGLCKNLDFWDFNNIWTWYGGHKTLSSPLYNKLNAVLLKVLYEITNKKLFLNYADYWNPKKLKWYNKIYIEFCQYIFNVAFYMKTKLLCVGLLAFII